MKDTTILVIVSTFLIGYYIGSQQTQRHYQPNQLYHKKIDLQEGHCGFCPDDCEPKTNRCKR